MKRLLCLFFLLCLPFSSSVAVQVAQLIIDAVQGARVINLLNTWLNEEAVLKAAEEMKHEMTEVEGAVKGGFISEREADEIRAEKEGDYREGIGRLNNAINADVVMSAIEEGGMRYNSIPERALAAAGAVSRMGALDKSRIGRWRKVRFVLGLAEILLGFLQARVPVAMEAGPSDRKIKALAVVRRIIRLLNSYLLIGKEGKQAKLSYILQAASIAAAFFSGSRITEDQRQRRQAVMARGARVADNYAPAAPSDDLSADRLEELRAEQDRCNICLAHFQSETGPVADHDDYVAPTTELVYPKSCGHVYCRSCLENWFGNIRKCPSCNQGVRRGDNALGVVTAEERLQLLAHKNDSDDDSDSDIDYSQQGADVLRARRGK